jgi:hypothetical protein
MNPTDPLCFAFWRLSDHQDETGVIVREHVPTRGDLPTGVPRFVGKGDFALTQGGQTILKETVWFAIEASSLAEAFVRFEAHATPAWVAWRKTKEDQIRAAMEKQAQEHRAQQERARIEAAMKGGR